LLFFIRSFIFTVVLDLPSSLSTLGERVEFSPPLCVSCPLVEAILVGGINFRISLYSVDS